MSKERSKLDLMEHKLLPSLVRAQERAQAKLLMAEQRLAPSLSLGFERAQTALHQLSTRLVAAKDGRMKAHEESLARAQLRLQLLDPSLVLQRGFAWLSDENGVPVTSRQSVQVGQVLAAQLSDGALQVKVLAE